MDGGEGGTPWYPTMRLFRQAALGDWEGAFRRMADELQRLVGREKRGAPARVEMAPGELLDRIGILEIKGERMSDPRKRAQVRAELAALRGAGDAALNGSEEAGRLSAALKAVDKACGTWKTNSVAARGTATSGRDSWSWPGRFTGGTTSGAGSSAASTSCWDRPGGSRRSTPPGRPVRPGRRGPPQPWPADALRR